jgi:hypothetical protein
VQREEGYQILYRLHLRLCGEVEAAHSHGFLSSRIRWIGRSVARAAGDGGDGGGREDSTVRSAISSQLSLCRAVSYLCHQLIIFSMPDRVSMVVSPPHGIGVRSSRRNHTFQSSNWRDSARSMVNGVTKKSDRPVWLILLLRASPLPLYAPFVPSICILVFAFNLAPPFSNCSLSSGISQMLLVFE